MRKLFLTLVLIATATSINIAATSQPVTQNDKVTLELLAVPDQLTITALNLTEILVPNRQILVAEIDQKTVPEVGQETMTPLAGEKQLNNALVEQHLVDTNEVLKLTLVTNQQHLSQKRPKWRNSIGGLRWLGLSG